MNERVDDLSLQLKKCTELVFVKKLFIIVGILTAIGGTVLAFPDAIMFMPIYQPNECFMY